VQADTAMRDSIADTEDHRVATRKQ